MLTYVVFHIFTTLFGTMLSELPSQPTHAPAIVEREQIETTRVAQVRLAEVLGTADAIHAVSAKRREVTFVISRGEQVTRVRATTTRRGEVTTLEIAPIADTEAARLELGGGLSWLADELAEVTAVTRLVADDDGAVTITTSDHRRYMAIPGRGSGGNAAVEARWAAAWDR